LNALIAPGCIAIPTFSGFEPFSGLKKDHAL